MAQKTELSLTATPGRMHSFSAKTAFVLQPPLGTVDWTLPTSRVEFTLTGEVMDFTLPNDLLDWSLED